MFDNMPLIKALNEYINKDYIPFHMPGHKLGKAINEKLKDNILNMDLTELDGTDNLHKANGCIEKAQNMLSKAYGSYRSYFLVNGSTAGILAMITTSVKPGEKIIVDRNCHYSVINGLICSGAYPVYIYPEYIENYGVTGGFDLQSIYNVLSKNPDAKAVLITYPNYYGICSDIEKIAKIVHSYNMVLLVDEAHGAHFNFNNKLPSCAVSAGADMCVQSAHKTLPALTQGGYIHVSEKVDLDRLERCLRIYQTSSPSYIIMAFLDYARSFMEHVEINYLIDKIDCIKERINSSGLIYAFDDKLIKTFFIKNVDKLRLTVNFKNIFVTGYEAAIELRDKNNIQVEMADLYNIICIITPGDDTSSLDKLEKGIRSIYSNCYSRDKAIDKPPYIKAETVMLPEDAFNNSKERVLLEKSIGKICADIIISYPPGVPIICPGEKIEQKAVSYIKQVLWSGGKVIGINKGKVCVLEGV